MKNSRPTSGSSGRSFFSSWTAPQNPIITLLKRRRESKTSAQTEPQAGGQQALKTPTENKQQTRLNARQPVVQTSFKITSSSSSTTSTPRKSNGTSLQNANDFLLKRDTNGFQPMKIEEYEPGHSSIALKEGILEPADYNPPICKPGELCRYSESKDSKNLRIRKKTETTNNSRLGFSDIPNLTGRAAQAGDDNDRLGDGDDDDDVGREALLRKKLSPKEDAHAVYRSVQKGGLIPEEGLRNLIDTRRVKTLPTPPPSTAATSSLAMKKSLTGLPNGTSDLERIFEEEASSRMGRKKTREEIEEDMRMRKTMMDRIIALEKLKKLEEEKRSNEARRHNDNFLPIEKSPVKLNRYDDDTVEGRNRNSSLRKTKFTAVAVYNFKAKNDRELSLRKGDTIRIHRQLDKNWFEGELNGQIGLFPITYVKIQLPQAKRDPTLRGKVLYDFNASAPPELSLYKGERVTVVGAIDDNWVEGRSRNGEGIFPLNYVKILDDDDDDDDVGASRSGSQYATPLHSRTVTPSFDHRNAYSRLSLRERPRTDFRGSSPVGSIVSSYAPTIPSAPLSPLGSQELDTTLGSFGVGDWPSLEASLLDLERANISQQQQLTPVAGRLRAERNLERAASLQLKYRPQQYQQHEFFRQQQRQQQQHQQQQQQQQQLRQQLLQLEREAEQQRKTQLRHSQLDRFQERSRDSPRGDFLSQSAHPDLCIGANLSRNSLASRSMNITRSATNSGLPERSIGDSYNSQSSPHHRYPSLISKDAVAFDNELVVKEMMAKQSEVLTGEFLSSRHGSSASLARSGTPLARHSLPVSKDSFRVATLQQRPVSRQPIASSSDYFSSSMTLRGAGGGTQTASAGGLDGEVFCFKEIKLKPRLPADYSRACYTVETRTSLPGFKRP